MFYVDTWKSNFGIKWRLGPEQKVKPEDDVSGDSLLFLGETKRFCPASSSSGDSLTYRMFDMIVSRARFVSRRKTVKVAP